MKTTIFTFSKTEFELKNGKIYHKLLKVEKIPDKKKKPRKKPLG